MFAKSNSNNEQSELPKEQNPTQVNDEESKKWGYDLYPERRRDKPLSTTDYLTGKASNPMDKLKCERNVYQCIKMSPLVKIMMGALKSAGCAVDIRRHIACEECHASVSGGYDPILNQIVICQNTTTNLGIIQGILTHEMIHMFDYCKNKLDFKNIDHLACTEIRAANLTHCSFLSAWAEGETSIFNVKETHQNCVKAKALKSVLAVRDVSKLEAIDAIERVFSRCYSDLEPIGRRIKRNSTDMYRAYEEAYLYGYDPDG